MKHVLLTGASGLVGRYLLRDLLAKEIPVAVLCRSSRFESAAERIEAIMSRWDGLAGRKLPRPTVLEGNLDQPGLGLDASRFTWIADHCDVMLHNAASMTFRENKHGEPFRTNVGGMENVLALCERARIRQFHHVSTAYVCGLRNGRVYEHELDLGQENGNVYEVSKMTAEKLVRGAEFLEQLTVYRPASVVGDSETGYTTSSHGFYLPLQMAYTMADKVPPELMGERFFRLLGLTGEEGKNLVAVDWLSQAIVELVTHPEHHGKTYHLTNPRPVTVRLIQQTIREAIEQHTTKRFVGTPTKDELLAYEQLFLQYMEIYRSHWRDDPIFDRTNTDRALPNLPCTEMDHRRMLAVASYPVKHKFVLGRNDHDAEERSAHAASSAVTQVQPMESAAQATLHNADIPIAIVGMACKLPGADNLAEYWELVSNGRSAIAEVPPERLDQSLYFDPRKGQRGKTYSKLGGMLASREFDREACPISPELAASVDNAHLLMCQVAAEACRHAGLDPFDLPLRNTGVYIGHAQGSDLSGKMVYGTCIEEAAQFLRESPGFQKLPAEQQEAAVAELVDSVRSQMPQRGPDSPDLAIHMVAGTISKAFGLNGPFLAINSACASSLHTIQLAARALQLGRIDMAIVGGASDLKDGSLVLFANAQSMSESGSRPFDENADGLICAEGYVSLVLKTLPRALADGDQIQAIVRGIGASSDGRGKSLWAPRKEGQVAAMERAYRSGLDMGSLQYVEAHATSTGLGDATELNSLSDVLAGSVPTGTKIPVTSVKANIGHTLEAAGIAGLIKTVLCMQHRTIAPAANIKSLNTKINWQQAPIYVPLKSTPWPEQPNGLPRRAAVNAFGIGGLNVHLVLEEFVEQRRDALRAQFCGTPAVRPEENSDDNAIAVIGIGCILPGAPNAKRYWELIASGQDPKIQAPANRWRTDLACEAGTRRPYRAANALGGYITDFAYDWKRHKVPPKQVEQADPLQFMLLDAAEQALNDAGYDKKEFDRTRTAVFVGTEFNGDFGTQLAISLRLPELERALREQLGRRKVPADRAAAIATEFSEALLKHWSALIDESGSFSTSTLASRITKTMNLMGGAAAIDAGDASAAAALASGIDLLISGDCDLLLCAGGQRSMNLPQFEAMTQSGILAGGNSPAGPFDAQASGIVPGEGVGMVLLKRLADARRDGDRIRAIIRGVGAAHGTSLRESLPLAIERALAVAKVSPTDVGLVEVDGTGLPARDEQQLQAIASVYAKSPRKDPLTVSSVVGQIGHTAGASAMVSLIKASLEVEHGEVPRNVGLTTPLATLRNGAAGLRLPTTNLSIRQATADGRRFAAVNSNGKGQAYHILLEHGEKVPTNTNGAQVKADVAGSTPEPIRAAAIPTTKIGARIFRIGAKSTEELGQRVRQLLADPAALANVASADAFAPVDRVRLAIVADSMATLAEKLQAFAEQGHNTAALPLLEQQGTYYRQVADRRPRIAFVFPGQGSQYPGMLRELVRDVPAAAAAMNAFDAVLAERGFPTFAQLAWDRPEQLGADIWGTQLAMLLANLISYSAITEWGIQPDLITGHSYGEFAAITAAGAWDFASVLSAARARVDGIEATPTARGAMLATAAPPQLIEQLAAALPEPAYLANYNAPDQTVVGGREASLRQLSKLLDVMGHKSQMIPVPCAFHTPWMEGSAQLLTRELSALPIDPPRVPLLSSVTNRFVAEPDDIRANLAAQLTTPVRYCDLVTRIATERDTVFVEVGPQQALTKLNRRILSGRDVAGITSTDHAKRPGAEQLLHVRALLECLDAFAPADAKIRSTWAPISGAVSASTASKKSKGAVTHVDATERRRTKLRDASLQAAPVAEKNGKHAPVPAPPQVAEPSVDRLAAAAHPYTNGAAVKHTEPAAPQPAPQPAKPTPPARNVAELEKFLINFVVEQTGYPPEVVELDADLEADLGIDSIKKAQLFGELAEYFDVRPDEDMTLDDFPTLRHVTEFLQGAEFKKELASEPLPSEVAVLTQPAPAPVFNRMTAEPATYQAVAVAPPSPAVAVEPASVGQSAAELEKFLINFVVEQTGYPPEVVELDADLEADLGIDSIKKAQLFGELAEYFDVKPDENMTLDDFPTLGHVVEFLARSDSKKKSPGDTAKAATVADDATNAVTPPPASSAAVMVPTDLFDTESDISHRYALRIVPSTLDPNTPTMPRWYGAALIVGDNPDAAALAELLATEGVVVRRLAVEDNLNATLDEFEQLWKEQPFPHVFLMMGRHEAPLDPANTADWERRRYHAATVPFYLCQRWVQLAAEAGLLNRSTLVAATSLGGDLGFSGAVSTPESGALTGLMKAIYIEFAVLRDYKTLLVKALDAPESEPSTLLAASICRELASRTVDYEVAYVGGQRYLQNAYLQPAQPRQFTDIRPGSVWVVTGGARGITALCARELGRRFGLKLHLVGSSPLPEIKPEWRELSDEGLKALQSSVMREARARGQSMDDAWARVRKDIEIDKSLRSFADAGIEVTYHECDVANAKVLARVLETIRQTSGPIEGILHGAGIERSCAYERKKPEIVEATLASKVDGAIHLMQLTRQDPIRHFIGFGSVSGRLGSNGQADYCMASDLLCKLAVWYRTWRPEVRSVGIHWHPWADVGMAATPETAKLLKLSGGPASMNKDEGVLHLLRELCADSCDTEVMITDDEYHGRYYCVDRPPLPVGDDVSAAVPATLPELPAWQPMASRHRLVMVEAPLAPTAGDKLAITGAVCILGQNRDAIALRDRLSAAGIAVEVISDRGTPEEAMAAIESAYSKSRFGHLFVMSARDESDGSLFNPEVWQRRRTKCVTVPFLAMQHWFRLRRQAKDSSPITIAAVTSLGGDFGLSGNTDAPEGGALCGLLKSLYVEDTRKPARELRVKVIDAPRDASPTSIVDTLVRELASDDPNVEVGSTSGRRAVVRSVVEPAESLPRRGVNHGGTWVVSGGARGITAAAALEMGKRFGLKLHVLGRSPVPQADAAWRNFTDEQLAELKAQTVRQAVAAGRSPERDWDRVKHDREIHETLRKFAAAGVRVTYHSCDVADRARLAEVLAEIRRVDGRIDGIVHGAGWARPGRFDSRSRDGMETTVAGKLDGAINLMSLTQSDPIRHWVGFGSISGRYGGNGLSDYAAANEMLAKLVDWYRAVRPDCASCCIHWQSWDEIGMAMLADNSTVGTKGVLKMDFISPSEGCEHLCRELEVGLPTSEVIITDGVFERIFHPHVQATGTGDDSRQFPLVTSTAPLQDSPGINAQITLDPQSDPFLIHHTLRGRPLLPAVVGLEALAEAATLAGEQQVVALTQVEFREGLKFRTEQPIVTRVRTVPATDETFRCELLSDFTNRAGVVMQKDRVHFVGHAEMADVRADLDIAMPTLPQSWHPFTFRNDGPMVHGPVFQGVKGVAFDGHNGWGELDALSLSELGGAQRGTEWLVPATLLDAAFYVCGIHLWLNIEPVAALPRSIARLQLGRMPKSGERAYVHIQCRAESSRHAEYDFTIFGEDRAVIAHVEGYQCVMLKASSEVASNA